MKKELIFFILFGVLAFVAAITSNIIPKLPFIVLAIAFSVFTIFGFNSFFSKIENTALRILARYSFAFVPIAAIFAIEKYTGAMYLYLTAFILGILFVFLNYKKIQLKDWEYFLLYSFYFISPFIIRLTMPM